MIDIYKQLIQAFKKETLIGNFNYTVGMSVKMMRNEIQVQKHVYL